MALFCVTSPLEDDAPRVWLTIPSARPAAEANPTLQRWRDRGYRIALWCDTEEDAAAKVTDATIVGPYPGYAIAVNMLVRGVLLADQNCDWCVAGGDDTWPDQNKTAVEIAQECSEYFLRKSGWHPDNCQGWTSEERMNIRNSTAHFSALGVMQPTGDRFAGGQIDRICGSPWMGREFCERANGGQGPFWPGYHHMWSDEEMQNVAIKLGILWQRRELVHLHRHFMRVSDDVNSHAASRPIPAFLREANTQMDANSPYRKLFFERKAAGFPGHELLPSATENVA